MIGAIPLLGSVTGAAAADSVQLAGKSSVTAATNAIGDFGQMLTQVSNDAVNNLKAGEATAISGLQGKATVQQVVEAVSEAQGSLQTALAVRDKAVTAYQDITRMSI
jgi:flagellar hook-basal body complex protein FliE